MRRATVETRFAHVVSGVLLWAALLSVAFPLAWILLTSFKPVSKIYQMPPVLFFKPTLRNYYKALVENDSLRTAFLNSVIVAVTTSLVSVALAAPGAYAIVRFVKRNYRARVAILAMQMLPPAVLAIPIALVARRLAMYDSLVSLIIACLTITLPFSIWLLSAFLEGIPGSFEEAALIDGCSRFTAFLRVVVPVATPGLGAAAILSFIFGWNEFLYALVLTGRTSQTLPVAACGFATSQGVQVELLTVAVVLMALPAILFGTVAQKYLVEGLTSNSLK